MNLPDDTTYIDGQPRQIVNREIISYCKERAKKVCQWLRTFLKDFDDAVQAVADDFSE